MSSTVSHVIHRKLLAIKKADAEPLTREDIQYDLLHEIFEDQHAVFTDPFPTLDGRDPGTKVPFRDLYVNSLIKSPRSSKVLREKILDTPQFGTDFAKISLLANVGRINTTMAFFPEMRTSLRTYHPVPSLQKTDGNLQDAPRIKNTLKACLLESEAKGPPSTPIDICMKRDAGQVPSTSVVNLIFVLANHAVPIGQKHFEPNIDFLDFFLPVEFTSRSRAQAFLWLCYHYLESPTIVNPFADDHSAQNPGKIPLLEPFSTDPSNPSPPENVDTQEEKDWGSEMAEKRRNFLTKESQEIPKGANTADALMAEKKKQNKRNKESVKAKSRAQVDQGQDGSTFQSGSGRGRESGPQRTAKHSGDPYPRRIDSSVAKPHRRSSYRGAEGHMVGPYPERIVPASPERTMLEHAWHVVLTTDPLVDSDEETGDEHVRLDYIRRLQTLKRIRGKSLTPEGENPNPAQIGFYNHSYDT